MKKLILLLMVLFLVGVACSSETASEATNETAANESAVDTNVVANTSADPSAAIAESDTVRLNEDYNDALPVMSQLAVGTIQLEETDLAVDEALAAEILPLWQAVQSLSSSDTAASVEIEAVLNQIQDTMQPAQVAAIAAMNLTSDSLTDLMESGAITFGRGSGQGQGNGSGTGNGGFTPPEGFVPGQGGGPGGVPGGGPGGGGFGGVSGETLSEDDLATRQAQFASGDGLAAVQDQAFVGAVIRLLQNKTGELPENPMAGVMDVVFTAVAEATGLTVEDIQAQMGEGTTLTSIIEANGGDVTAVREALISALNELPNAAELDVEQIANSWLGE
ncbi:MAG: hypothetical protein H6657_21835 [Ardenticatenaceae bacterium]|nr:hypothetical protein [Ardenticatenaceae bacterium]